MDITPQLRVAARHSASASGFALFDTEIGSCGIVWNERGVVGVQLPEGREPATRARVLKRFPRAIEGCPPREVQTAIEAIASSLRGERSDLSKVALDMEGLPQFQRRVYEATRAIPPGATLSYGELASQLGAPALARAVGQALGQNPFPIVVPCHRVLAAGGRIGGFSAAGGVTTKLRLLSLEGQANGAAVHFDGDGQLGFDPKVAVNHLRHSDPAIGRLIDRVGPFRMQLDRAPSIFAALAEAIVYQQLNGRAAEMIFARVRALFPWGLQGFTPQQLLRTSDEKLRGAGLSQAKLLALRDLARKAAAGEIPSLGEAHRMEDEAIIESLSQVRGIGRWTAEMLLIFRLGRPDVLPVDDYGIRQGFAVALKKRELPTRQEIEARGARWKPYRTVASWYLWRAAESAKR